MSNFYSYRSWICNCKECDYNEEASSSHFQFECKRCDIHGDHNHV